MHVHLKATQEAATECREIEGTDYADPKDYSETVDASKEESNQIKITNEKGRSSMKSASASPDNEKTSASESADNEQECREDRTDTVGLKECSPAASTPSSPTSSKENMSKSSTKSFGEREEGGEEGGTCGKTTKSEDPECCERQNHRQKLGNGEIGKI